MPPGITSVRVYSCTPADGSRIDEASGQYGSVELCMSSTPTSMSTNGAQSAARSVLALSAIGRTVAIEWVWATENAKSIRTRATPIDRNNSHGESPSSRAVFGETSATIDSPADAAAETIAVAAARVPAVESSGMCER